jgi:hypothetical protein
VFDNATTRFAPALNNVKENGIFSDLPVNDRIDTLHEYPQDFDQFIAADWTLTLNGGSAALVAGDGGVLQIQTVVSNFATVQKTPAAFPMTKGKRGWNTVQVQVDNVLGLLIAGLLNATATPFTGASQTDGCYFLSTNTGALSFNVAVGGVIASVPCNTSLIGGAYCNLSWYYDGACYAAAPNGRVVWQADGAGVTSSQRGEIVIPAAGTIAAFPGATNMAPIVGVSASTAAVRTLLCDKLYQAKDEQFINATPAF